MIRSASRAGSSPEALVLAADPDGLAADGGPTAVSPERIIDLLRRNELSLERLSTIVAFLPSGDRGQFCADLGFILSKSEQSPQMLLLADDDVPSETLERLPIRRWKTADLRHQLHLHEGSITMAAKRRVTYIDNPDQLKRQLKDLLRNIHDDEDPHELTAYKRFVKRHVSIFSRAYLTAYLVKELVENGGMERPGGNNGHLPESKPAPRRGKPKKNVEATGNVPPEDRQTLFVSVGKNRRVYPKDFVALFAEIDGVEGDDIGQIKILDNYSFVEVDKSVAESIIDQYNGYEFRGRKLTVNYARNKKD